LLSHGLRALREAVLDVAQVGLAAGDPTDAVERRVSLRGRTLVVDERRYALDGAGVVVVGAGKASLRLAQALEARVGACIDDGLVVVPEGGSGHLEHVACCEASHPLPDEHSAAAAEALLRLVREAGDRLVITCFTGGSSSLACAPPPGVSLDEKRELHRLLLRSGASIVEINAVRKHVSALKGGRLAALAAPSPVIALTVSDVAGDPLDAISDPSVQDTTTRHQAVAVLKRYGLWQRVAPSIREHLDEQGCESPVLDRSLLQSALLVTGKHVCDAMEQRARELGFQSTALPDAEGESSMLGPALVSRIRTSGDDSGPRMLVGCGGEATVTLGDEAVFAAGGPNQEAALAAALTLGDGDSVAAVFLDTDGRDGGSSSAGALIDGRTAGRAREAGVDLAAALAAHRSGEAFGALGDAVALGATGINVNDLFVIAADGG
jgi:hydroxypyruvate reductase/glycerate 2-kinase